MECKHCKASWTVSADVAAAMKACPFCGQALNTTPADPAASMAEVLQAVISHCGISGLRNGQRALAVFTDLAPHLRREKIMFSYLIQCGGHGILIDALQGSVAAQLAARGKVTQLMVNDLLVNEDAAREVCGIFWAAISGADAEQSAAPASDHGAETAPAAVPLRDHISGYPFPSLDLLCDFEPFPTDPDAETKKNRQRIKEKLAALHIDARITTVTPGPCVSRYELKLAPNQHLYKLTEAADDIAGALDVTNIRIVPDPNRCRVAAMEVPNANGSYFSLKEVLTSAAFAKNSTRFAFAVGKDIDNNYIISSLGRMPHLLIAGDPDTGKSNCVNSLLLSLLYRASPADMKLIITAEDRLDMCCYDMLPHLVHPVIIDPLTAIGALKWASAEMTRRLDRLAQAGTRDLDHFNSIRRDGTGALPRIVIVIDELAVLMRANAKETAQCIHHIAQTGHTAGIHLIISTRHPSADVLTAPIRTSIPSHIAFAVKSPAQSRLILDTAGAEKLLGWGDMLFAPAGVRVPQRIQGCRCPGLNVFYVRDFIIQYQQAHYDEAVISEIQSFAARQKTAKPSFLGDLLRGLNQP